MNWEQFFELMTIDEKAARAKYELALCQTADPKLREVLTRLRDEEIFHAEYLQESWVRLKATLRG